MKRKVYVSLGRTMIRKIWKWGPQTSYKIEPVGGSIRALGAYNAREHQKGGPQTSYKIEPIEANITFPERGLSQQNLSK